MINWKRKLTSRKFWLAVIGFVTAILIFYNVDGNTIERVTSIIMAGATLIAFIIGEGLADSANAGLSDQADTFIEDEEFYEEDTDEDLPLDEPEVE